MKHTLKDLCNICGGKCCRYSNQGFIIYLTKDEACSELFKNVAGKFRSGLAIKAKNGKCPFLDIDGLCSIYENRPKGCREFNCIKHYRSFKGEIVVGEGIYSMELLQDMKKLGFIRKIKVEL